MKLALSLGECQLVGKGVSDMEIADVVAILEDAFPLHLAAEWDNVGLQVGDPAADIDRIMVSLDITSEVVAEAREAGAELIVSHHPLVFDPLSSVLTDDVVGGMVADLLRAGISLYVAHTNLDGAPGLSTGIALAQALEITPLGPLVQEDGAVWGVLGETERATTLSEFADFAQEALGSSSMRVVARGEPTVSKVALMPGAGGDAVRPAAAAGADLLVCGDLKHHDALDALALDLAVIDAGHYATERPVISLLSDFLQEQCGPAVNVLVSDVLTDPFARSLC